jgi:TetR/AcrR family transcriptional regulator, regulator of cefoperazone and chloramphenicol sensitivity
VKADAETRERVLETAKRLFSERGFKRVTVRDICLAARANVAAVNYHFGDKLGLYREVLQSATDAMRETNDAAREAGKGQPPEEELRRYIGVFLHRVLPAGSEAVHRLITREMNDPTPALDTLVEQGVRPRVEYLSGVIARMIGCDPKDPRVLRCVASIQAQAVAYFPNPIAARLGFPFKPTPAEIDKAAHHIATFSIAGVRAVGRSVKPSPREKH